MPQNKISDTIMHVTLHAINGVVEVDSVPYSGGEL